MYDCDQNLIKWTAKIICRYPEKSVKFSQEMRKHLQKSGMHKYISLSTGIKASGVHGHPFEVPV